MIGRSSESTTGAKRAGGGSRTHRIAVIPGDGVGPEVVAQGIKVLKQAARAVEGLKFELHWFDWNSSRYRKYGEMMPRDGLSTLSNYDAIYFGAVGEPGIPDHVTLLELLIPIRKEFDQWACVRPLKLFKGVTSPLRGCPPCEIDMVIIRENTEGEYADSGGRAFSSTKDREVAVQSAVFTRRGTERIIRYAFELAQKRKGQVLSVTKSNAQRFSMVFWDEVFEEVARGFPAVSTGSNLVDAAAMNFVRCPERFDVVVASNLFGDILADLGAAIVGGMGLAPSANLNPSRDLPSCFEPVHGSAPDIAGRGIANPVAAILSAAMMVEFLGYPEVSAKIGKAVEESLAEGAVRTPDLGGSSRTQEVGDDIARRV